MNIRATIPNYAVNDMTTILKKNGYLKKLSDENNLYEFSKMMMIWGAVLQQKIDSPSEQWTPEKYDAVLIAFKKYWNFK